MKATDKAPKRLLFIITGLSTGGAEMMLYKLLSRINREKFEPMVISLMDQGKLGDRISELNIPVYTIGMKSGIPTPDILYRLISKVRQLKPDLIQGWMYHGNLAAQFSSILFKHRIPVLWDLQNSLYSLEEYEKKMTRAVIRLSIYLSQLPAKIIFVSKIGQLQHQSLGYCSSNSCVIPNGTDTSLFTPSVESKLSVRHELGLSETSILIGLIARFHPMKDHKNFLKAAALLSSNYPNLHFLLAGQEIEPGNRDLYEQIQKLGLVNQISLLGERTDIPRLTAALDISSLSSAYSEGFPMVVGEAMSCGIPCVVTDVGDSAWIVGNTGQVVPPQNSEALCAGWRKLIDMGVEARRDLGVRARKRIEELFSLDQIAQQYEQLYEEVIYGEKY